MKKSTRNLLIINKLPIFACQLKNRAKQGYIWCTNMKKHFIEIIEEGESCTVVNDVFMCRNKDYKDPYMCRNKDFKDPFMLDKEISPCMCRNKDFKDPYMELEQISKVA